MEKNIIVLIAADYKLKSNIVGGMDRFFWAFDKFLKQKNFDVKWSFPLGSTHVSNEYNNLEVFLPVSENFAKGIEEAIVKYQPDVLITHFVPFFNYLNKRWKKLGVEKIIAVDHMSRPINDYSADKKIKLILKGLIYRKYLNGIVSVSNYVQRRVKVEYWGMIPKFPLNEVVYNGIDYKIHNYDHNNDINDSFKFVSVGNVTESKGFHLFVEALGLLKEKYGFEKYSLDIIGDGPYLQVLNEIIKKYSLQKVKLHGARNDSYKLLHNYDIAVQPSLWKENFPFTIIESFASGLPVLASNTGGLPELINDKRGWLFKQGSVIDLMEQLENISGLSKSEISEMSMNSRKFVENYLTLENMVKGHYDFLIKVLSR